MYRDVNKYIDFLVKNYLTQDQFLMLYLIRTKDHENIKKFKQAFPKLDKSMIGEEYKQDLIDRGFVQKTGDNDSIDSYVITEKFNKLFLKNYIEAADEFWAIYPSYGTINGTPIPLKNMDKYQFANAYVARINNSVEEHLEVLEDLKFGIKNNLIKCGIEKFVVAEMWSQIRQIRLKQKENTMPELSNLSDNF